MSQNFLWVLCSSFLLSVSIYLFAWAEEITTQDVHRVITGVENFRLLPNGDRIGTLFEDVEVKRISQDGKWVRVRVEGWIWGPSLSGFVEEKESSILEVELGDNVDPLLDFLPRVRRFVNDGNGTFYGINIDQDFRLLRIRMRIGDISPERLMIRQHKITNTVWGWLSDRIDVDAIRVETNRPDGSGSVGLYVAETVVEDLGNPGVENMTEWKKLTRFSKDGGNTWGESF